MWLLDAGSSLNYEQRQWVKPKNQVNYVSNIDVFTWENKNPFIFIYFYFILFNKVEFSMHHTNFINGFLVNTSKNKNWEQFYNIWILISRKKSTMP